MAFINFTSNTVMVKIVYYGPGLSGKTTNLRYIYEKIDSKTRGEFITMESETGRTYFFDLLPIRAGFIREFRVHFQLMTVPGQVRYEASRRNVLMGTDGVVFVADSQEPLLTSNVASLESLFKNCRQLKIDLDVLPLVFQYNKRDLEDVVAVDLLNSLLNPRGLPYVEAEANGGRGVFETLREIAKLTIPKVREKIMGCADDSLPLSYGDKKEASDLI